MSMLDPRELSTLLPAETSSFPSPIPTQFVSSDEFLPGPQTENQKQRRSAHQGARQPELAKHQGMTRAAVLQERGRAWPQRSSR